MISNNAFPSTLTNQYPFISSVQLLNVVWLCNPMDCSTPGFPIHHQLPEFTQTLSIESVMPSNHLILCCPLLLLPSTFPSIRALWSQLFASGGQNIGSFSCSISPSSDYSGLISFRVDWLDLLVIQGILKSLLQHHSSKPSILQRSAFFTVQLTSVHDYWKNHSLCCQSNVSAFEYANLGWS